MDDNICICGQWVYVGVLAGLDNSLVEPPRFSLEPSDDNNSTKHYRPCKIVVHVAIITFSESLNHNATYGGLQLCRGHYDKRNHGYHDILGYILGYHDILGYIFLSQTHTMMTCSVWNPMMTYDDL